MPRGYGGQAGMNSREEPTLVGKGLGTCRVAHREWWSGVLILHPCSQNPCLRPTGNTASYNELDVGCLLRPGWQPSPSVGLQSSQRLLPGGLGGCRNSAASVTEAAPSSTHKGSTTTLRASPGEWGGICLPVQELETQV